MTATNAATTKRSDLDFAAYRAQLLALKETAQATIDRMATQDAEGLNSTGTDRAELSGGADNHPADLATEMQLRTQDAALAENERMILHQIDRALAKLDDGTYGLSDVSGEPIAKERLDATPYALTTIDEAQE